MTNRPYAGKRPTISDVAEAAGVSRGTVSRVLNGGKWVSPSAAAAVNAAIERTGYRVNPHARNLATATSNSIAFLLTEPQHVLFDDPNFSQLIRGAAAALEKLDRFLVVLIAGTQDERNRAREYITGGHVDGVLLAFSSHEGHPLLAALLSAGVPTVAAGQPIGFEGRMGSVSADEFNGARTMVRYLIDSGRKRIAHISGPLDTPGGVGRLAGYQTELGPRFDESLVATGDYSRESGERAMRELLVRRPDLDAVFAASDVMAAGALAVLQQSGRAVPDDVAVAGFDDSAIALRTEPQLTTMRQPFERISAEMVRLLVGQLEGESPASVILPTTLVKRASA
jgi:DNA-binding LacI/PurR family transcriptional regulator